MTTVDTITQRREDWLSASVVNHTIVTHPTIRQPGFDLTRHTWSVVNSFPTDQGSCHASLHKLVLAQSLSCDCGQTIKNVVDTCPLTNFEGGLNLLHETNDDAVIWLESRATAALAKYIIQPSCPGWMRTIRYDTMSYVNMRSLERMLT